MKRNNLLNNYFKKIKNNKLNIIKKKT
jgi:hypothetical protein